MYLASFRPGCFLVVSCDLTLQGRWGHMTSCHPRQLGLQVVGLEVVQRTNLKRQTSLFLAGLAAQWEELGSS